MAVLACRVASCAVALCAFSLSARASYTEEKVTASDGAANSYFGSAAALNGSTALIGADGENSFQGAAYIFNEVAGVWSEGQKLTASDGLAGDEFGYRVALRPETAVVTAFSATVNGVVAQGSAYVYTKAGDTWSESQKLTASDGGLFDNFGASVAISSEAIAIRGEWRFVPWVKIRHRARLAFLTKSGSTWCKRRSS